MNMTFVCISHKKLVSAQDELEAEAKAKYSEEIQRALNEIDAGGADKLVLCLQGGGIAARGVGRCPEMAVEGSYIAVLSGTLQNYAYLVRKYCLEELSLPSQISLESIRELTPVREAALLCKLYERLGTGLLTKLRGKFAFCLFDSRSLRVLAARDCSGAVPLVTGETDDGFVFVASGDNLPQKANKVIKIEPGKYIYGWHSPQTKYANPLEVVEKSAAEALVAAAAALKGITLNLDQPGRGRSSSEPPAPFKRRASSSDPPYSSHSRQQIDRIVPDYRVWRPCAGPNPYHQPLPPQHLQQQQHIQHLPHHPHPQEYYGYPQPGAAYYQTGFIPRESRRMSDPYQPRIRRTSLDPNWKPAEESTPVMPHHMLQQGRVIVNSNYAPEPRRVASTYSQEPQKGSGRTGFKLKRNKHRSDPGQEQEMDANYDQRDNNGQQQQQQLASVVH